MFALDHSVAQSVYQQRKKPTLPIQELSTYIAARFVYLSRVFMTKAPLIPPGSVMTVRTQHRLSLIGWLGSIVDHAP